MRAASMFPLAFTAVLLAGCGESPRSASETAGGDVEETGLSGRDLTLQTPSAPAVEVASPVELARPTSDPRPAARPRVSRKRPPAPAPDPVPEVSPVADSAAPVPAVAAAEVLTDPAPVEDVVVGVGRELPPGKTVTIIPASSGPSSAPEDPSWAPTGPSRSIMVGRGGGGGGKCRPRGGARGIGIARIPIGVPGRGLR